jgi:hypothetical protein
MARGFYSVVQYCPDRFRAEAVNVGLVLLCVDPHALRVKMTSNHDRVRKLFAIRKPDLKNLKFSTDGLTSRIENSTDELRTSEDLSAFAASRANDLLLTEPRLAKLGNFDDDFERLFAQLVEQHSTVALAEASPAEVLPPGLGEVFYRLQQAQKIWRPGTIIVPVYKRKLDIPYAYKNGVVNLVKPHVFPATKRAETQAAELAINGDLLQKHPVDGENQQLIVISTQETLEQAREVNEHVEPLFREYGIRLIRPANANAFAHEVEQSAH